MPWLKSSTALSWIELVSAVYGFHGVGWLVGGFFLQGLLRMIAGWVLLLLVVFAMAGLSALADMILPYPYLLILPALAAVVWPVAAIWSARCLRTRLERGVAAESS